MPLCLRWHHFVSTWKRRIGTILLHLSHLRHQSSNDAASHSARRALPARQSTFVTPPRQPPRQHKAAEAECPAAPVRQNSAFRNESSYVADFYKRFATCKEQERVRQGRGKYLFEANVRGVAASDPENLRRCAQSVQQKRKVGVFGHDDGPRIFRRLKNVCIFRVMQANIPQGQGINRASTGKFCFIQGAMAGDSCASIQRIMPPAPDD